MKRLVIVILTTFVLFCYAKAQLNMDCDGNVGIGVTPNSTYKLYSSGNVDLHQGSVHLYLKDNKLMFKHSSSPDYIYMDAGGDEVRLYPSDDEVGYCGTSSNAFFKMYSRYVYQDGSLVTSDFRAKENIRDLSNSLEKIMNIRGIKYDLVSPDKPNWTESKKKEIEYLDKDRIGFIAQELVEFYPELVKYDEEIDQYSVDYLGVIPILVEAIKEQQEMIDDLQNKIHAIQNDANLKSASINGNPDGSINETKDALIQNSPNPFSESTEILFSISEKTQNATLNVYNLSGTQLKSIELYQRGEGSIIIYGGEFDPGIYLYALITDGIVIDTKQMVLTN